jgi:hypothetical protein
MNLPETGWAVWTGYVCLGIGISEGNSKAIPLHTLTGPEGSRRLRLPDFKKIGT